MDKDMINWLLPRLAGSLTWLSCFEIATTAEKNAVARNAYAMFPDITRWQFNAKKSQKVTKYTIIATHDEYTQVDSTIELQQ